MAVETARRFSCDASVVSIIEDEDGEPLSVGRKTRSIPPALRRALNSRDRGCRFPGCPNKHYVDGHHIKHWVDGGETRLSNLALLCRYHHRQVHEGGIAIKVLNDGALRFILKGGNAVVSLAPARLEADDAPLAEDVLHGNWLDLFSSHNAENIVITDGTAVTRWTGESMDYSAAVGSMLFRTQKAKAASTDPRVSAETPAVRTH